MRLLAPLALLLAACSAPAPDATGPLAPEASVDCGAVDSFLSVYFVAGEANLDAHGSRQRLDENAVVLAACPALRIVVRGTIDSCTHVESADSRVGLRLSQARADSVATYYLQRGVPRAQIARVEGLGADPRVGTPCDGPEVRAQRADTVPASALDR